VSVIRKFRRLAAPQKDSGKMLGDQNKEGRGEERRAPKLISG